MMYDSYDEIDAVLAKLAPQLEQIYADKGFVVLAWADAGWVHFFTKSPVRIPDDLRAQKLFSWAGDNPAIELWKAAGFNPVPLPSTEISTALQTGLVTAVPTTSLAAVLLQWYTPAPYMTDIRWAVLLGRIVLSKAAWEKIPAELRPAFQEPPGPRPLKLSPQTREGEARDVEAMSKRGLTVVTVDAAALAEWRPAPRPPTRGPASASCRRGVRRGDQAARRVPRREEVADAGAGSSGAANKRVGVRVRCPASGSRSAVSRYQPESVLCSGPLAQTVGASVSCGSRTPDPGPRSSDAQPEVGSVASVCLRAGR